MNLITYPAPPFTPKGRDRRRHRQCAGILLGFSLFLGSCSSSDKVEEGVLGFVRGFLGGVVADEPRAAMVGRDVLSAGGSAADAAVAVFFTMAVTRPSVAGLGSQGQCLVFSDTGKKVEALDFTSVDGVPGAPRGMFAMHAKYGKLRWEQMIASGESLARFGFPVSRGFARDLSAAAGDIAQSPDLTRLYRQADGSLPGEGNFVTQFDLAATLALLRRAPGDFYNGAFARQYVEAAQAKGLALTTETMRAYTPQWRDPIQVNYGLLATSFSPNPGGAFAARLWTELAAKEAYRDARPEARPQVISEAILRAMPEGTTQLPVPSSQAGASFLVADRHSSTVACSFSMGKPFGNGRVIGGTGITPAAPLPPGEQLAMAPMIAINPRVNKMFFAAVASGGSAAPTATIEVALGTLAGGQTLTQALAVPRVHPVAAGTVLSEPQTSLGFVNGFNCPKGLISPGGEKPEGLCDVASDRRGFGLALQ